MDAAALTLPFLFALIAVALAFDFLNGMSDAANSIATIVSTRVLRPQYAVAWAAFFKFIALLFFGLQVADTVGRGIVDADVVNAHVLIGGLVGAGLAKAGIHAVVWSGVGKTVAAIFLSPGLGLLLALFLMLMVSWIFVRSAPYGVDNLFRRIQFVSASCYALGHGGNDAQKTMGIIAVLLYSQGTLGAKFYVPFWVVIACQIAMAAGTLAGGWRIVKTMGSKITRLTPMQGSCAETAGSVMLFTATYLGIPVSTTHTITGSIIGVGASKKVSAVRWVVAREIVTAWIITIPASGLLGALFYWLSGLFSA